MRQAFGLVFMSALAVIARSPLQAVADQALNVPSGATFHVSVLVGGLSSPTAMAFAPDGRLFVSQKAGSLRVVQNGVLLAQPFVTIAGVRSDGERGLLGVEFDPNFATNGYLYVFYSYDVPGVPDGNRVSRFTADAANPNRALAGSERILLDGMPQGGNHNAGALHFGPDGKLYISLGDVGVSANAQSLSTVAGKILRIDPQTFPNVIPPDNPFVGVAGARQEIWARGLRNPFTFAFDSVTGRLHINDVGQNKWEEINQGVPGANYGWPTCEGPAGSGVGNCSNAAFTYPIHAYQHPAGYAITCGTFYNAPQFPAEYQGGYFFGDYVSGWLKSMSPGNVVTPFDPDAPSPVDCRVGPDGSLYYLSYSEGVVVEIRHLSGNAPPTARFTAVPASGPSPLPVVFDATTSSDPESEALTYSWNFGDGGSGSGPVAMHTFSNAGVYSVVLTVTDPSGASSTATQQINAGGAPTGIITSPAPASLYSAGDILNFSGTAVDPDDGVLGAPAFSWTIVFHHNTHTHPFVGPLAGVMAGSVAIPTIGEADSNVFYRVHLTVTDSDGLTHTSFVDVSPRTASLTLDSLPQGLTVTLDGQPVTTPYTVQGVAGFVREISAPVTQAFGGGDVDFAVWTHGGERTQSIATPVSNTTYIAAMRNADPSAAPKGTFLTFSIADTVGDHLVLPGSADLGEGSALTVSMWFRPSLDGTTMQMAAKGRSGSEQWMLRRIGSTNRLAFSVRNQSLALVSADTTAAVGLDHQWHHVTGTYDGQMVRLYVDGSSAGTVARAQTGAIYNSTNVVCVGALSASTVACSSGTLRGDADEVRIWNRALSPGEVVANMEGDLSGTEPGLTAFLPINEGLGQTVLNRANAAMPGRLGQTSSVDSADPAWSAPISDQTPPVISNVRSESVTDVSAIVAWTTNESADTQVEYGLDSALGVFTSLDATLATLHGHVLEGLQPGTTYYYRVRSRDDAGNLAVGDEGTFTTLSDLDPPVISGVQSQAVTEVSAVVAWNTNEPADTQVEYGLDSALGVFTPLDSTPATVHGRALAGLQPAAMYYYRVRSRDAAGNLAVGNEGTFTTLFADVDPPVISDVRSESVTQVSATVAWNTNEPADSEVEYGVNPACDSWSTSTPALVTAHSMALAGMQPATTYCYRVRSSDGTGNASVSGNMSFTTAAVPQGSSPKAMYLGFDGGDTVRIESSSGLPAGPITVALWVRTTTTGTSVNFISKGRSGLDQWLMRRIGSTGRIRFQVRGANGTLAAADSPTNQGADGLWHHYAGTWDGATVRLYVDGSTLGTTSGPLAQPMRVDDEPVCVGSFATSNVACGGTNLTGDVDDVSLWNRALSQTEIQALMAAELTGVEAGLLGYWRMNEGAGQTVTDATGNNLTGLRGNRTSAESSDPTWKSTP